MHNIDHGLPGIIGALLSLFSRSVSSRVEAFPTDGNVLAVRFVDNAVDFFEVVYVRDNLVAGNYILSDVVSGCFVGLTIQ